MSRHQQMAVQVLIRCNRPASEFVPLKNWRGAGGGGTVNQNLSQPYVFCFLQQAPPSSTVDSGDSFRPGSLFRQLADQDEDTAAPSLFKLSWLSGMAK